MKIGLFDDVSFEAMPEYDADDVKTLFDVESLQCLNHRALHSLTRESCDVLIVPYIDGDFSDTALDNMLAFHRAGGSLLFLGDLPHNGPWYPYRNMRSYRFHLTRSQDPIRIEGLTPEGERILCSLENVDYFRGRDVVGLRFSAYPPDRTHTLIRNNSGGWQHSSVIAVDRYSPEFLGAKLAVVGFNGGEPRESVDGSYPRPWRRDPGMLTKGWSGIGPMILKLVEWLQPNLLGGAIRLRSVYRQGERHPISIHLRNLSKAAVTIDKLSVMAGADQVLASYDNLTVAAFCDLMLTLDLPPRTFGIHEYKLCAELNGDTRVLAEESERVFPAEAAAHRGFGFSTFWSFSGSKVAEEYRILLERMIDCGVQYTRNNIPWEDVEPEPGVYDWSVPDELSKISEEYGLGTQFWMFPTTRGSGLGDGGVPRWILQEPAIDRDGNPGYFPSLWSPFYQQHFFAMLEALIKRYADTDALDRFVLDFGNSDFPYGYYYYVNDTTLFDYSPHERDAFAAYLKNEMGWSLATVSSLFGVSFAAWGDVPVPRADEDADAWRVYLGFRTWSIREGIQHIAGLIAEHAPSKVPPDLPGHGLGSIADLGTGAYEVKSRHWFEEKKFDPKYTRCHNAGETWGGEAWQVGGGYKEYDDALFQSVRYNATYLTIPGPDIGVYNDDIARIGFIRRALMGMKRKAPPIAVIDATGWADTQSLAHVAARLDQGADILNRHHRFDFSCYKLLALPADELQGGTVTGGGGGSLLPTDESWYWVLREAVMNGLRVLVFPQTCQVGRSNVPHAFLRQVFGLEDVHYGPRKERTANFPTSFGGGTAKGHASSVDAQGTVLLRDEEGKALLVEQPCGKGAILLAGYDNQPDSMDGELSPEGTTDIAGHTLPRVAAHLGILPDEIDTGQRYVYKDMIHRAGSSCILLYSHFAQSLALEVRFRMSSGTSSALDLATGEVVPAFDGGDGWFRMNVTMRPKEGRYLYLAPCDGEEE